MITLDNYSSQIDTAKLTTPALKQGHEFITEFGDLYGEDEQITKAIKNHMEAVNKLMSDKPKKKPAPNRKAESGKRKKASPAPKKKSTSSNKKKGGGSSSEAKKINFFVGQRATWGDIIEKIRKEGFKNVSVFTPILLSSDTLLDTVYVKHNGTLDDALTNVQSLDKLMDSQIQGMSHSKSLRVIVDKNGNIARVSPNFKNIDVVDGGFSMTGASKLIDKAPPKKKPAAKKEASPKKKGAASTKKKSGASSTKSKTPAIRNKDLVRTFDDEIRIIKRFAGMISKNKPVNSWVLFHRYIQKKFAEKAVHGNSKLAPEVNKIADITKRVVADAKGIAQKEVLVKAPETLANKATKLAKGTAVYPSVSLMKRYINLQGEVPEQSKLNKLISSMESAIKKKRVHRDDPFGKELETALENLKQIRKTGKVEPTQIGLSGADGLAGLAEYFGLGK